MIGKLTLVGIVLLAAIGGVGWYWIDSGDEAIDYDALITQSVVEKPFDHIVLEQGEVESSSNTEITCKVKSRDGTTILWVVEEGSRVKAGDKLVELDQTDLEARLKEQKIEVITAEAEVTTAEALVQQAKISRQEYLEGVFKTEEKAILSAIAQAEQELRKAELAIQSSQRLVAKGLVKSLQLDADRFAVVNAKNTKEAEEAKLRVLRELTRQKMLVQFDSDIEAAEAKLSAAKQELLEEQTELAEVEEQLENCVIYAPTDGVVVHANRFSGRGGNAEFVVEAGASVRERQAIIRLPDPSQMQVKCKINESRITLVDEGMPARIRIDAIPGMLLTGRVQKVNRYAEPGSWYSSAIKEYATFVEIIDPPENIRTGMTAECQIFVEQLPDALQIPVEGLYEHDGKMYSLVRRGDTEFETVPVKMQATNDTMVAIAEGLQLDDEVVLNLRQHMDLMELPDIASRDNSDLQIVSDQYNDRKIADTKNTTAKDAGLRATKASNPTATASGGGRPSAESIVKRSMERNDTDKDGKLSSDEIAKIDRRFRGSISEADSDGDGFVSRSELLKSTKAKFFGGGNS